ncbi:hypothetical protein [Halalkalicoccus sp. NIPERK01]|uniref:hypothetical protein n=1 Tax=Halalkalicoccus sp. NIPERK01 TaxID=3053469 RepID=UPI00256F3ADB|nr:hypothetical protein [Halalkalicoccus sp. NIPERK01]MDL5361124.1 hypothetical protein [Halalkalicoccus sp. NIPERK01]
MKHTLSEARSSPVALAVFLLGLAVFVFAVAFSDGSWGAPVGSPEWLLGAAFAALAVILGVRSWLQGR